MALVAEEPGSHGVLAFAQAAGLGPVVHDNQPIAQRGDLVFLLSRRIRAHCGDVHTGAGPVAAQYRPELPGWW